MRGKARTNEEKYELFDELERYLKLGFSLKKACNLADVPYSTMRDITTSYKPLRAYTSALQNDVNVRARQNVIDQIDKGDLKASQWWIERFDTPEPQLSAVYGGESELAANLAEEMLEGEAHGKLPERLKKITDARSKDSANRPFAELMA
jgi:hypothetical protein